MGEVAASKKRPKNLSYWINSIIVFVLMFGIGQLPPFGEVTPLGMQVLGIFVGVLYGWCTVSLLWPSLVGIVAVGATDYCTVVQSFSSAFGAEIPLTIVVVYILATYVEESGLSSWIANWFISRKIGEGHPWIFTMLIFAAAYVMSAFISLFATIIILWTIFYKICEQIGEPRQTKYTAMVISGIVFICGLTAIIFPFKTQSVIQLGLTQKALGTTLDVNFITWTGYNFIVSVTMIAVYLLVCKFVLRPDLSRVKDAGAKYAYLRGEKMTSQQKIATVVFLGFILGLMLPSILPKTIPGIALLSQMGIIGLGTICMIVLAIAKTKENKSYVDIPHLVSNVNWELVILVGATMPLCNALEAEECGVLKTVIGWMTQTFSGLSGIMFLVVVIALFLVATQVAHNIVLMLVFTPVLTKMGLSFGLNPMLVMMVIVYTAMSAYATPAASSQAALIFGNNEWIKTKDAYLNGFIIIFVSFIVLVSVAIPLGQIML